MKLLAITSYYKPAYVYGGPVHSEAALYEGLTKLGVDLTVITTNANGEDKLDVPFLTPVDVDGVKVIYCPTNPAPGSAFYSSAQIKAAKQQIPDADIINLQTFWGYATGPLSQHCINHKIPYFVFLDGQLMDYAMRRARWTKRLKKRLFLHLMGYRYLNGAAALFCSSSLEISYLQTHPINTPTFLVTNSIDVNAFKTLPPRGRLRIQYHIPKDAMVMVMIGRLHAVKNPHIAVAALIAAQKLSNEVHLLIVGPDEHHLQPTLEEQARQAGCADKLHFTGLLQKDALLQAMADSDLLVMPSESENFGMSAAESMAAGLPILVSDSVPVGAWAKQAFSGETSPCNRDAFSKTAVAMLNNSTQLKEMGQNGKAAAANLFGREVVAEEMRTYLERIIAQGKKHNV